MSHWLQKDTVGGVHVVPADDLVVHIQSESCICAPTAILLGSTCYSHGTWPVCSVRKLITHEAMDGRE